MTDGWVGQAATAWVFEEAPDLPASLVSTLLGFARHADQDGRNSFPSVETLVRYTRKSERQVRADIKELRKRGLLVVSADQSAAAYIRADRRPTVYELPIPPDVATPGTGCSTPHAVDGTPTGPRGAVQRSTGCSTASNGVQSTAPEEDIKKLKNKTSLSQPTTPADMLAALGVEGRERDSLIQKIEEQNNVNSPGWWITAFHNGTLADCLHRARADPGHRSATGHNGHTRYTPFREDPAPNYHGPL